MTHRLGWITDPHLNFLTRPQRRSFYNSLLRKPIDSILITGDIAEGINFNDFLNEMAFETKKVINFVLGNHDFYRGSLHEVRANAVRITKNNNRLRYLSECEPIELTPTTALIGHDGWYDGRCGNFNLSPLAPSGMADFKLITDFVGLSKNSIRSLMETIAEESAEFIKKNLHKAFETYDEVILGTHVPPFRESAWHLGKISDDNWAPFFSNKILGDTILEVMAQKTDKKLTCLVGHSHSSGIYTPLPNIVVKTGAAEYYNPSLAEIINIY